MERIVKGSYIDLHLVYYSQIKLAMMLSKLSYCYFKIYTSKALPIVRTDFDKLHFLEHVNKLNYFYKNYLLKVLC